MLPDFALRPMGGPFSWQTLAGAFEQHTRSVSLDPRTYTTRARPVSPAAVFAVCQNEDQAHRVRSVAQRAEPLDPFIGSVAIVELASDYVTVYQHAPQAVIDGVASALVPFLRTTPFRVFTEDGEAPEDFRSDPGLLFR